MSEFNIYESSENESKLIVDSLIKYNFSKVPFEKEKSFIPINRVIKNENGDVLAGINSMIYCWDCLRIDTLWVKEEYRNLGYGSILLNEVEKIAIEKGCKIAHLDTFDFQAVDFYKKHGFEVFGVLEHCPRGHKRYYFKKILRVIEVVPYNPRWKEEYALEAEKIKSIIEDEIISIHHIGSTSIEGIDAKPTIDILVEVKNINNIDEYNNKMQELRYISMGEFGIEGRRFFIKGLCNRTHHVHIFEKGSSEIRRHLDFRDYMINNPDEAKKYAELKKKLAKKHTYDSNQYANGKSDYIRKIEAMFKK